ncbi:hypothetical protein LXL04_019559 [Taraxacum kok-saghyz]
MSSSFETTILTFESNRDLILDYKHVVPVGEYSGGGIDRRDKVKKNEGELKKLFVGGGGQRWLVSGGDGRWVISSVGDDMANFNMTESRSYHSMKSPTFKVVQLSIVEMSSANWKYDVFAINNHPVIVRFLMCKVSRMFASTLHLYSLATWWQRGKMVIRTGPTAPARVVYTSTPLHRVVVVISVTDIQRSQGEEAIPTMTCEFEMVVGDLRRRWSTAAGKTRCRRSLLCAPPSRISLTLSPIREQGGCGHYGSLVKATAPVLSQKSFTGSLILGTTPRSLMNSLSHIASFDASLAAMYSDSQVDSATVSCLELFQDTAPPFNKNTQPDCERASSRSVWKLASV